jgi:hypothetical protein
MGAGKIIWERNCIDNKRGRGNILLRRGIILKMIGVDHQMIDMCAFALTTAAVQIKILTRCLAQTLIIKGA